MSKKNCSGGFKKNCLVSLLKNKTINAVQYLAGVKYRDLTRDIAYISYAKNYEDVRTVGGKPQPELRMNHLLSIKHELEEYTRDLSVMEKYILNFMLVEEKGIRELEDDLSIRHGTGANVFKQILEHLSYYL